MNPSNINDLIYDKIDSNQHKQSNQIALLNKTFITRPVPKTMLKNISICIVSILIVFLTCQAKRFFADNEFYKQPSRIFNLTSKCSDKVIHLNDYQDGNLNGIYEAIELYTYTFIYLYADWDAKSNSYKDLITKLACEFSDQIHFQAINCFHGDCRKHFNLAKYPQLLINIRNIGSYSYKGPLEYNYLNSYLKLIQRPLQRLDNFDEFFHFLNRKDGVLIGNFDFLNKNESETFKTFYMSCLNTIHLDFENSIGYGVVFNQSFLKQLQISAKKTNDKIMLFTSNGFQKSLKNLLKADVDNLERWISKYKNTSALWFYPDKIKSKTSKNNLLVFVNRLDKIKSEKIILNVKYMLLKNQEICGNTKDLMLKRYQEYIETNYINDWCERKNFLDYIVENECDTEEFSKWSRISLFLENTDLLLVDSNLYSNYASNLIGEKLDRTNFSSIAILIDNKNESIYRMDSKINVDNLSRFILNQSLMLNKRVLKVKQLNNKNQHSILVREINSVELEEVTKNVGEFINKDILVFYYNNWCGFCKLINYNLILIVQKYFKNSNSFIILKIDVDSNDLKWNLYPNYLPTLIFFPASKTSQRKSILYESSSDYSIQKLVKFILFNSDNPETISNFLIKNVFKSKLRFDLVELIAKKVETISESLKTKSHYLNEIHLNDLGSEAIRIKLVKTGTLKINILKDFISGI